MADRSDRLPPYRRPEGEEDLFTPAVGIRYPVQPVPPPGQPGADPHGQPQQPQQAQQSQQPQEPPSARPMSRREAREATRRGGPSAAAPAPPPARPADQWWEQDLPAAVAPRTAQPDEQRTAPPERWVPQPDQRWTEQSWAEQEWAAKQTAATDGTGHDAPLDDAGHAHTAYDDPAHHDRAHHDDGPDGPAPQGFRARLRLFLDHVTDVSPGRRWTMPLAALLLAGWSATVFADVGGTLGVLTVTLATLTPLVSVLAIPVATLSVRRRRWESALVAVTAALLPWYFVLGYATAEPPPTKPGVPVTVLVVNAHAGRAEAADIVAAVRTHRVDVLVVTELSRELSHELTAERLGSYVEPRWFAVDDVPERGLGVWSRLEVEAPTLVPGTSWPAVSVTVSTRSGDLDVIAGHAVPPVPNAVDRWQGDLDALKAATRGQQHVLLVGTFNASPWHAQYRHLLGRRFVDAADALGRGLRPTWPTWTPLPLVPMDSAIVGRDVRAITADTVPVNGTDHRALLVTVQVPGEIQPGD